MGLLRKVYTPFSQVCLAPVAGGLMSAVFIVLPATQLLHAQSAEDILHVFSFTTFFACLLMLPMVSLFALPICLFTQIFIGAPVGYIFSASKTHWSLYAITGYALSLCVEFYILGLHTLDGGYGPSFVFAIPSIPQALLTYYYFNKRVSV